MHVQLDLTKTLASLQVHKIDDGYFFKLALEDGREYEGKFTPENLFNCLCQNPAVHAETDTPYLNGSDETMGHHHRPILEPIIDPKKMDELVFQGFELPDETMEHHHND